MGLSTIVPTPLIGAPTSVVVKSMLFLGKSAVEVVKMLRIVLCLRLTWRNAPRWSLASREDCTPPTMTWLAIRTGG